MKFITRAMGATRLALRSNAPTIMVAGGVGAMFVGTVLACRNTLKVEEVLAKHTPDLEKIQKGSDLNLSSYNQEDAQNDRFQVYARAGVDLVRLYAVPGVLLLSGAGLVFQGHRVLVKRNATLALAFTGLKKSFDSYRARVVQQLGSEQDQAFLNGSVAQEVVDPETGETMVISTRDWEESAKDPYNRVFSQETSTEWVNDLGVNQNKVAIQQQFAQGLLVRRGHLYLSEVYQSLGLDETDISRVVGWKVTTLPDGSKNIPHVDFGLDKPHPDDWKYSREKAIYLDFNCQGLIVGGKVQAILEQA